MCTIRRVTSTLSISCNFLLWFRWLHWFQIKFPARFWLLILWDTLVGGCQLDLGPSFEYPTYLTCGVFKRALFLIPSECHAKIQSHIAILKGSMVNSKHPLLSYHWQQITASKTGVHLRSPDLCFTVCNSGYKLFQETKERRGKNTYL